MTRPVALDLCVGLGGWVEGLTAEGWRVIGVDIEDMFAALNEPKPDHFDLVIGDICDVRGSDYAHVDLIVASPPCQKYSWMAMPWSLAKAEARRIRTDESGSEIEKLNRLFNECFRIRQEASEAAGRHIPLVVENVRGAEVWVGRARWNAGAFYLWADVPALMPKFIGRKVPGFRFDGSGKSFQTASVLEGRKGEGGSWVGEGYQPHQHGRNTGSGSKARKAASARIAKIPFALSSHIARVYRP